MSSFSVNSRKSEINLNSESKGVFHARNWKKNFFKSLFRFSTNEDFRKRRNNNKAISKFLYLFQSTNNNCDYFQSSLNTVCRISYFKLSSFYCSSLSITLLPTGHAMSSLSVTKMSDFLLNTSSGLTGLWHCTKFCACHFQWHFREFVHTSFLLSLIHICCIIPNALFLQHYHVSLHWDYCSPLCCC